MNRTLRFLVCTLLVQGLFLSSAYAQLSPEVLKQIKDSTVLIKSGSGDQASTGSGFFVYSDHRFSLIATNAHVIATHLKPDAVPRVQCILNSGQPSERSVQGEVHCVSAVDDLVLLKVTGLSDIPVLEADGNVTPTETQRVYAAGFPFGEMLGVGNRNPNVTITETSISSVRLADTGMPEALQTSGGIDPGNSGGPIVDNNGQLVGISVAKLRESSIGFAIPTWKLQELLPPSLSDIVLTKIPNEKGYRCSVNLSGLRNFGASPIPQLLGMKYSADQKLRSEFKDGRWTSIPGLKQVGYSVPSDPSNVPFNKYTVLIDLNDLAGSGDQMVFQWRLQTGVNRNSTSEAFRYSRPLFISREDLDQVEQALAGESPSSGAGPGSTPGDLPEETVVAFDSYIRRCMPAGGGRYLVLWLVSEDIVVIDLKTKKQVAKINNSSADILVAGKESVVAFNKLERTMTTYRLPELELAGTRPIRDEPIVRFADWGADCSGPIAAIVQRSGEKFLSCVLIDPSSGKVSRFSLEGEKRQRGKPPMSLLDVMPVTGEFELRMNESGNVVTMWLNNTNKPQVHVMQRGRRQWSHNFFSEGAAYGYPSPTGKVTFSAEAVLARDLGKLHDVAIALPTLHDDYFLTLGQIVVADPPADRRTRRTRQGTFAERGLSQVEAFTWHLASVSDADVHRSWTFRGDLNEAVLLSPRYAGIPLDERFLCVPLHNVLAAVLPESPRGASKNLRLYDLGERLPGAAAPDLKQTAASTQPAGDQISYREWTDASGRHTLEASVVAVKQGYVKLRKKDGSTVVLKVSQLSVPDRQWLANHAK